MRSERQHLALKSLPFVRVSARDFGVGFAWADCGRPAWPVASERHKIVLERVALIFGAQLQQVRAVSVPDPALVRDGVVACDDPSLLPLARLYAHLTRRSARLFPSLESALEHRVDIWMTLWGRWGAPEMETLWRATQGHSVGVLVGDDIAELTDLVLGRSAAAAFLTDVEPRLLDLLATSPGGEVYSSPHRVVFGGDVSADSLQEQLALHWGVVQLVAHADGLDVRLGHSGVTPMLCPIVADADWRTSEKSACEEAAFCRRLKLPMREALGDKRLLSCSLLKARVALIHACYALGESPKGPTVGKQLVSSPSLGAVIGSWDLTFPRPSDMEPLALALARGMPVGSALERYRKTDSACSGRSRLILYGDPDVMLPLVSSRGTADRALRRIIGDEDVGPVPGGLGFLDSVLRGLHEVEAAFPAVEASAGLGDVNQAAATPAVGSRLAQVCEVTGELVGGWSALFELPRTDQPWGEQSCVACGEACTRFHFASRDGSWGDRVIDSCPRCGVTLDRPDDAGDLSFEVVGGRVRASLQLTPDFGEVRSAHLVVRPAEPAPAGSCSLGVSATVGESEEVRFSLASDMKLERSAGRGTIALLVVGSDDFMFCQRVTPSLVLASAGASTRHGALA